MKQEWEKAHRSALFASSIEAQALRDHESGVSRELLPDLSATATELAALATEKKNLYLRALSEELLHTQYT